MLVTLIGNFKPPGSLVARSFGELLTPPGKISFCAKKEQSGERREANPFLVCTCRHCRERVARRPAFHAERAQDRAFAVTLLSATSRTSEDASEFCLADIQEKRAIDSKYGSTIRGVSFEDAAIQEKASASQPRSEAFLLERWSLDACGTLMIATDQKPKAGFLATMSAVPPRKYLATS